VTFRKGNGCGASDVEPPRVDPRAVVASARLEETVHSINDTLSRTHPDRFVTLFIAELDPPSGTLKYINCGHNPPIVARANGGFEQLDSGGLPVGLMAFSEYESATVDLGQGDALVVYSDGVRRPTTSARMNSAWTGFER